MTRITMGDLESLRNRINEATKSPLEYSSNKPGEKFSSNIGHYHLDGAYGGWKLVRTMNNGGGITEVTYGFISKRELYNQMQAFLRGVQSKC